MVNGGFQDTLSNKTHLLIRLTLTAKHRQDKVFQDTYQVNRLLQFRYSQFCCGFYRRWNLHNTRKEKNKTGGITNTLGLLQNVLAKTLIIPLYTKTMRLKLSFVLSVCVICMTVIPWFLNGVESASHDFAGHCKSCHLSSSDPRDPGILVKDVMTLCNECHGFNKTSRMKLQHPVQVVPSMELPPNFPLDSSGRMTCITCHDPHAQGTASNIHMLRSPEQRHDYCQLCHTQSRQQVATHPIESGIVHPDSSRQIMSDSPSGMIDSRSAACLRCHDGTVATEGGVTAVGESGVPFNMGNLSHPIGTDYDKASFRKSDLIPSNLLPPEIILPDGKVGCESCHNLYSQEPYFLVISNRRSALCYKCHSK